MRRLIPFLLVLFTASTAHAGKVIVLAVNGDSRGELEDGLTAIVEDRHDIVTSGQAERVARRAGLDELDGPALGKLAKKLGADAVVEGTISTEDEGYLFVVRIRGKNGKTVKKISVNMPKPRLTKKAKKQLGMGVLDGIDTVLGVSDEDEAEDEAEEPAPREAKKAKKAKKAEAREAKKARKQARDQAEELAAEPEPEPEAEPEMDEEGGDDEDRVAVADDDSDVEEELGVERDGAAPKKARVRPAIVLQVGPSAKARTLAFNSREFDQQPLGYKSSLVPGARIVVEAYPLALSGDGTGATAGLGVAFDYDKTIAMTTRSSDAPDVNLETIQQHWDAGLRYRIGFGKKATSPTATLGVDYGRRVFQIKRDQLPAEAELDMPDVDYKYIAPGLQLRLPIGSRMAVHAGGRALLLQSAGDIQAADSYGGAKITGFEAGGGLQYMATRSIFVNVEGSLTQIGYVFLGNGE
jgi:opacity protein-like surface antigen